MPLSEVAFAADLALLRRSRMFDARWYVKAYPEVAMAGMDPLEHFLRYGAELERNPSPHFDCARYRQEHPQLFATGENPLVHHLRSEQPLPGPREAASDTGPLRGYLDRANAREMIGWAVDNERPGEAVELSVFAGGDHVLDLTTADRRDDLVKLGVDGNRAGFVHEWSSSLFPSGTRIDVRFKRTGQSLKRSPLTIAHGPIVSTTERERSTSFDAYIAGEYRPVTVIVPIFNAWEAVAECLASLCRRIPTYADVLLIDDCSTDPRIGALIAEYADLPRTRAVTNEINLGYTRTINKGIGLAGERDVVLLNSDTLVTERWLDSLRYCAYARPRVATVTALSNNAGAFSVPVIGECNAQPTHLDHESFARVVTGATPGTLLEVPTGNGFCFYIRRQALDALGTFDEERYPRGYGEENDFCMRALRGGWRNIVSDKAFVLHKRSQSFGTEKTALISASAVQLTLDYPEYRTLTARFRDVEFTTMRSRIGTALALGTANTRPRAMYVISTTTGGTPQTNLDLMRAVSDRYDCWLLRCDSRTMILWELVDGTLVERETHWLDRRIEPATHRSDQYDQIAADLLYRHSITLLHIRHIAWHSLNLPRIARSQNIPVVYSFHDFYSVCPSLNLLDNNATFCGGRCTAGDGECPKRLWPDAALPHLKHRFVHRWQAMFREFLASCDAFITTAPSAAATICDSYPELLGKIEVIPHGRNFAVSGDLARQPKTGARTRILVPGNIGSAKGSELIRQIIEADVVGRYEFHFLGAAGTLKDVGVHHGTYDRSEFHKKVSDIAPAIGIVFSLWAETYCHTLTEMWSCGIPVVGIDLGAVGDRIRASGGGWLMDPSATAVDALRCIDAALADVDGYAERRAAIGRWQRTEARWNDTATMAQQYRRVYQRVLGQGDGGSKVLGLLYRQTPSVPATAFIRAVAPWRAALQETPHHARAVDADWLLAGGTDYIDALLIQRNAVPPDVVNELVEHLRQRNVPYIYEIDDPIWDLPLDHPDYHAYSDQAASIIQLISNAERVTTTTQSLADLLAPMNANVTLLPNTLDWQRWSKPIADSQRDEILARHGLYGSDRPRILYMGTKSHATDLKMILPAIAAILQTRPEVEFLQVGGGATLPGARLIVVPGECASYPEFVIWFRAIATAATIAVAPLRDTHFNSMKSDIKALDYAAAGLPCVFSAVGPYLSLSDSNTAVLVANDTDVWIRAICMLLDDQDMRARLVKRSHTWAADRHVRASGIVRDIAREVLAARDLDSTDKQVG